MIMICLPQIDQSVMISRCSSQIVCPYQHENIIFIASHPQLVSASCEHFPNISLTSCCAVPPKGSDSLHNGNLSRLALSVTTKPLALRSSRRDQALSAKLRSIRYHSPRRRQSRMFNRFPNKKGDSDQRKRNASKDMPLGVKNPKMLCAHPLSCFANSESFLLARNCSICRSASITTCWIRHSLP